MAIDLATAGYLAGWRVVRWLPEPAARRLFNFGADRASKQGRGMEQLRRNLARVVGHENVTQELIREATRSYGRYWQEAFRLPSLVADEDFLNRLEAGVSGYEYFHASVQRGRGVVLTLPHSGNWDMAGVYLVHRFGTFSTVAERLRPEALFDAFVDYRTRLGFHVLPLTGGDAAYPELKRTVEAGGVVCLLGERDLKAQGASVEFFGETTTMPTGSVRLAQETGAALHVVHSWFSPQGWGLSVDPELPVTTLSLQEGVQAIADGFARNIARHPADWHMLQPLWPADIERRHKERRR